MEHWLISANTFYNVPSETEKEIIHKFIYKFCWFPVMMCTEKFAPKYVRFMKNPQADYDDYYK